MLDESGDVLSVRTALTRAKAALALASYDYAYEAVSSAQKAYTTASNQVPCVVAVQNIYEAQKYISKATNALNACLSVTGLLLTAEETGDKEIDGINAIIKVEQIDQHVISAMLEGAVSRIESTKVMLPVSMAPGARCNPPKNSEGKPNVGPNEQA